MEAPRTLPTSALDHELPSFLPADRPPTPSAVVASASPSSSPSWYTWTPSSVWSDLDFQRDTSIRAVARKR
ncbi:hypothetical protein GALMADRAFT_246823 [Galerina marginata CBS 339.88]|uniref:Uncharacterized protein n=1 Tax=Galerina marginata (strain CBS 339.88) TaxID=685588 RepID=A0A067TBX6_GALM3|nr:hypothetical protein GALMADRAFT_246823 [Galerina marginata CBS 339.88]